MFTKEAARKTCDWLMQNSRIDESKWEVYEYGLDKLYSTLLNIFIVSIIGILFGVFLQTLLFYIVYISLRVYAGGYHAKSPIICFFLSISVMVPSVASIHYYHYMVHSIVFYCLLSFSIITLVISAPVDNKNKVLDSIEKKIYRYRMLRNLILITILVISLSNTSQDSYTAAVLCGMVLTAITAGIGKLIYMYNQIHCSKDSKKLDSTDS
ncbi:MAG: accessory gene regulator B family protein [Oscillospiraceae bacterium]|jgi:accessory gene regulator B|nr:accessory gene regulator B family protein [Oscillospiraceae bacterium]